GEKIAALELQIFDLVGHPLNLNSTQQLAKVLYEELQLPSRRRGQTGYSTDADTLEELRPVHPIAGLILDYRQLVKLKSTYVDSLPLPANPRTRPVHTSYHHLRAPTRRPPP